MPAILVLGFLAFWLAMFIFFPLAVIWGLNTLFPVLAIPFTFWTWLAVVVLGMFLGAHRSVKVKKD